MRVQFKNSCSFMDYVSDDEILRYLIQINHSFSEVSLTIVMRDFHI